MSRPPLYLSHDAGDDWLSAIAFGRVGEGQPAGCWLELAPGIGVLHDRPGGTAVGFLVKGLSRFDADAAPPAVWEPPLFDVPAAGLRAVSVGEATLGARAVLGGRSTLNRELFHRAAEAEGEDAARLWRACLEAGDPMAHYGLGYALHELGRHREAYRHLRHSTEIAPCLAWAWCWRGKAAEAIGETREAACAYRRAIALGAGSLEMAEARERLARLGPAAR